METLIENSVNSGNLSIETILSEAIEFSKDYWVTKQGIIISTKGKTPKILKEAKCGYKRHYSFVVISHGGKQRAIYVHRTVAEAFCEKNSEEHTQVNHINGNTDDNSMSNLEWVTPKQNSQHAHRIGLSPRGASCPWAKTTDDVVRLCFKLFLDGMRFGEIVKATGLTKSQVYKITRRQQWKHLTEDMERATTIPTGSTLQADGRGSAEQPKG